MLEKISTCTYKMTHSEKEELTIFHIVAESNLELQISNGFYEPDSLKTEGFIHCTSGKSVLLSVAEDYYSDAKGPFLILEINLSKIQSQVKFEAPSPIPGGGKSHMEHTSSFPHIYGALNISAINSIGVLSRKDGKFVWPKEFMTPSIFGI